MSFLKILSRFNRRAGQAADPGRPDDPKLLRPTRVTVVSFRGTVSPTQSLTLNVKVRKNISNATLIEVGPQGQRGLELEDELAMQPDEPPKPEPPMGR